MVSNRLIFWSPRILGILYALFISLFALDVFSEGQSLGNAILAFIIHLVPTYIVIISLVIAWKRELIGSILFIAFALFYIFSSRGESWVISGPLFLLSFLFLVSWIYKTKLLSQ